MTPQELTTEARCYSCIPAGLNGPVIAYLLNQIAATGLTPEQLLEQAKCYACIPDGAVGRVNAFLLNQILQNGGGGGGSGFLESITSMKSFDGEEMDSTQTEINFSLLESVDQLFFILSQNQTTVINLPLLETVGTRLVFGQNDSLLEINAPLLVSTGGWLNIDTCPSLTTINLPLYETCGEDFGIFVCASLASLSLPSFIDTSGVNPFNVLDCPILSSVSLPSFLPGDGKTIDFTGCALTAASVNHILARCIASAPFVSGSVVLSGGTNAAPTGQGITDKNDLIARGVTVTTN